MSTRTPDRPLRVAALVLAAGQARRMGCQKLLLPLQGQALITPALRAAMATDARGQRYFSPVAAVVGPHSPPELRELVRREGVAEILAPAAAQGQAHSLAQGLAGILELSGAAAVPDGVCVLLGDQPLVDAQILRLLHSAFAREPEAFVAPCHAGRRGNPVIIPRAAFDAVAQLRGDAGARTLLSSGLYPLHLVEVTSPAVLEDVDTREAYEALCHSLARAAAVNRESDAMGFEQLLKIKLRLP